MTIADGHMTVCRLGRTTPLQRITDESYYQALRAFGARDSVAQGVVAKLITVSIRGK